MIDDSPSIRLWRARKLVINAFYSTILKYSQIVHSQIFIGANEKILTKETLISESWSDVLEQSKFYYVENNTPLMGLEPTNPRLHPKGSNWII